jgi:hypothetical protein
MVVPITLTAEDRSRSQEGTELRQFQPEKTRARRPDLFLHEVFEVQGAIVQFGTVIDGATVICRAHGDLLEDIEKLGLPAGSRQVIEAFHRHEGLLCRLALEKAGRGLIERDGTIFLGPKDLDLLDVHDGRGLTRPATVRRRL